jgi:hypothetical protein
MLKIDMLDEPHDMVRLAARKSQVQFLEVERHVGLPHFFQGLPAGLDVFQGPVQVFFLLGEAGVGFQAIGFVGETGRRSSPNRIPARIRWPATWKYFKLSSDSWA